MTYDIFKPPIRFISPVAAPAEPETVKYAPTFGQHIIWSVSIGILTTLVIKAFILPKG